ncbi:FxSxx-COOH system tetratricopeptide repeat protein [Actinomadura luteofluorescens]|uniref:FxSxx-COOH system tetratricopeptide repeat protein n=1 Tax=Actinomadura luteofluorescens TaxID=46163 RepID=UPI00347574B3
MTIQREGRYFNPPIWGRIPTRNINFTGRETLLDALEESISGQPTVVVPHALHGFGGVGKTQMAVEYAYRHRDKYELVWWVPADQPMFVRSSLAALATELGFPPTGVEDAAKAALEALQRGDPTSRWLLIFDNADQPEDIKDFLPSGPGHVLVTSRNHRWEAMVETVSVDVFTREESVEFLRKRTRGSIDAEPAARLAAALGDLPLALEQAGALHAESGMEVEEYLELLRERTSALLAVGHPPEYPMSMTAAWSISVSSLGDQMPEAIDLLRCCAFFGPEPIPRDVFSTTSLTARLGLGNLISDRIRLGKAISELGRYALLKIDLKGRTVQVHRLVQALIREDLTPDEQESIRAEVHQLLVGARPGNPDEVVNWPNFSTLVAHLVPTYVEDSVVPNVRALALDMVRYLYQSGDWATAHELIQRFHARWTEVSGGDDPDVLRLQRELGYVLRELGQYQEAYDQNQQTLAQMHAKGLSDEDVLRLVNSLGADLRARGEFGAALAHDSDSLQRHEAAFGRADHRTLRVMNNLALDYDLNSRWTESKQYYQEAINLADEMGRSIGGAFYLGTWNGLARAARMSGEYSEACDMGEDAYAYGVEILGREHPWTLRTAKDLSIAQRRYGDLEQAKRTTEDTHARCVRLFGLDHPDTLAAATALTNLQRNEGREEEAATLMSDTVNRCRKIYGPDHPYTLSCLGNLAVLRRVTGNVEEARSLNEEALAGVAAKLSDRHHYYLNMATNLASDLAALGDLEGARDQGALTLSRLREVMGADHPMTLACAGNLSVDLEKLGLRAESEALFAETEAHLAHRLPRDHPDRKVFHARRHLDCDFDPPPI